MTGERAARRPAWAGDERLARAALSRLVEPGDVVARALLGSGSAAQAVDLLLDDGPLPPAAGTPAARRELLAARERWRVRLPGVDPERDVASLDRLGGRLLVPGDAEWPRRLDDLGDRAPVCLWVRGTDLRAATEPSVALVGARACTPYGEGVAAELAAGLAARGVGVVSGGAYGIDAAAHRAALSVGGATTAVLACGVDRVYPRGHDRLFAALVESGALVAEVPLGCPPGRWRFLERNRLIAALAGATVVVEAAWRSGALSTAHHAAELARPLGAVPGPVTSAASAGCHRLVREVAATCVTDVDDVLELLAPAGAARAVTAPRRELPPAVHDGLPPQDLQVLDALSPRGTRSSSAVATGAGLPVPVVEAALGRLALRDLAVRAAGGWRRAPAGAPAGALGAG